MNLEIGDEIFITRTTNPGHMFIGTIGTIMEIDLDCGQGYKFRILMGGGHLYWGNGVVPTSLNRALL